MKTIEFNTGREYTSEGQFIKATLHDDGVVTFFDHSRCVDGEFKIGNPLMFGQSAVMHWYDSGDALSTARSWADGMSRGGCNAR